MMSAKVFKRIQKSLCIHLRKNSTLSCGHGRSLKDVHVLLEATMGDTGGGAARDAGQPGHDDSNADAECRIVTESCTHVRTHAHTHTSTYPERLDLAPD